MTPARASLPAWRRTLATAIAASLVGTPLTSSSARAEASDEPISFSEYAPAVAGSVREAGREMALKARELPVSSSGAFSTSIAIDVPPGRRGMTPTISLSYSSQAFRSDSAFGAGWNISLPMISRSTAGGFPQLVRAADGSLSYDDGAQRAFEGPAGRLVAIDCAADSVQQCPPESRGFMFVPEVEREPVRYEQLTAGRGDRFVEYLPDGRRRFYGAADGVASARVKNELGTFSWLLVKEIDRFGNSIIYEHHTDEQRADKRVPQRAPVLARVRWGGNDNTGLAHLFSLAIDYRSSSAGGVDFLRGGVRHVVAATTIRVGSGSSVDEEYWRYALEVSSSAFSGRDLLRSVERRGAGEAETTYATTRFHYSGATPRWDVEGVPLPDGVFVRPPSLRCPQVSRSVADASTRSRRRRASRRARR